MTRWLCRSLVAALVATSASACTLYFGDDTGENCLFEAPGFDQGGGIRNPQTNQCEFFGGGGGGCGGGDAVPLEADDAPAPQDWAQCFTNCEGLDEQTCMAAPECRVTFTQTSPFEGGFRFFSGCVGVAPSGPVTGEACQGLDGYGCSRHNDCVAVYGGEDVPDDGYNGSGVFVACEPEPTGQSCFSSSDCGPGFQCSTEQGDCLPPPGCDPSVGCEPVCTGVCIPVGGACTAIDCGPGFHCEELCSDTLPGGGAGDSPTGPGTCSATCIPDQTACPIECPPNSVCVEECAPCNYPGDPACEAPCRFVCQEVGTGTCADFDCGPDAHCEEECRACDPLPDGTGCEHACQPFCVPNPPGQCDTTTCAPGSHCELQCRPSDPNNPMGPMDACVATCVLDPNAGCAEMDCAPGNHCIETCLPSPCMDPAGCPDQCRGECVPDGPGDCEGDVVCDSVPPACPSGTQPGVSNGCWTGYCIPSTTCDDPPPPLVCEALMDEASCQGRMECTPVYTGLCTPNPDGSWTCTDTEFTRCATRVFPTPF